MKTRVPLVILSGLAVIAGCGGADTDSAAAAAQPPADTAAGDDTAPTDTGPDATDPCADIPLVTYNNFGNGFMTENCQGCHASTTADRYGAPESVTFDSVDEVWALAERILARAASDDATMPPAGGVSEEDRTKLGWWLQCTDAGS
jgi:uncharacterized membrane protein